MPVPWEALIPFGLLTACFAATGTLFRTLKQAQNDGKDTRYSLDDFERMMLERDRRLTGHFRRQRTDPIAPKEFATNSVWQTERVP
ncbi:hypothetical protein BCR39DRAFT_562001 [Naematelia encephala]|uniref:NADH dehydrogenase [ubiquinone] 1 alpha subcomplex subunit 1 n=1 Tax=Naematelia encephala TaxID=71784 RepID=A0A1Y2AL31_9TREE|nr:hypothetical protein BCR39DRAFT_562001 [Naematelia encephala]